MNAYGQSLNDRFARLNQRFLKRCERLSLKKSSTGVETWLNWVVRLLDGARIAGYVQVTIAKPNAAEIAYLLFRDARGHGFAREAVATVINQLREHYAISDVFANVDPRNIRSINLLVRLGFTQIALESGTANIRGSVADEARYWLFIARISCLH